MYPNEKTDEDPCDFLLKKGWARFCDVLWALMGSGWIIPSHLTQKQKDKILELTQEWFDWKMGNFSGSPFFTSNKHLISQHSIFSHNSHQ